jgi:DUF1009 family protein
MDGVRSDDPMTEKIGLIAGSGQFPILFAQAARNKGLKVYATAYKKEADPKLAQYVDGIEWVHLGQVKRLLRFFHTQGINQTVIIGAIRKTRLFTDVKPDAKALKLVASLRSTHDDGILRGFAGLLEKEGIRVRPSTYLLPDLLAPAGCWTRRKPNRAEERDIALGWRLAKAVGKLDIGQCVVLGGGSVLAVEAIDGTDATLRRGGLLGKGQAVAVKVCKPNQDTRFDIPAVGAATVDAMAESGVGVLAIEAQKAVVFDRREMIGLADQLNIAIVAHEARDFDDNDNASC